MSWIIPIKTGLPALCLAFGVLAGSYPVQASVSDFRLPPDPSEQQPTPTRQGPVAPDVPESRGAPTPVPSAQATAPAEAPIVVPELPVPERAQTPAPTPRPSAAAPGVRLAPLPSPATTQDAPVPVETPLAPAVPVVQPSPTTAPVAAADAPDGQGGRSWWIWAALGLLVLGVLAFVGWRRRTITGRRYGPPEVERPRITPVPPADTPPSLPDPAVPDAPTPAPAAATAGSSLQVELEPVRLSLTLLNAALAYRLTVTNRGGAAIEGLQIVADMISAHASLSREEQLSGPRSPAATMQRIDRLEPGERRVVQGEFRLPFPQIVPIRQGSAALLMPLARFRLETGSAAPLVRTFVVGQPGSGAGLQPFRLDLGPRVYPTLTQRAFA